MKKSEVRRKFFDRLEERLPNIEGFKVERKQNSIFVDRKILLILTSVATASFSALCVLLPITLVTSCSNESFPSVISPTVSVDETLGAHYDVSFPIEVSDLPNSRPFKPGVYLSDESFSNKIAYHGTYHGYDVYSTSGRREFLAPHHAIMIGNFYFSSGNPYNLYCHEAGDSYELTLNTDGDFLDTDMTPFFRLYGEGVFSDQELLEIYLQRISFYRNDETVRHYPCEKTSNGYRISAVVDEKIDHHFQKGFPFEGKSFFYKPVESLQLPDKLKDELSLERNRVCISLGEDEKTVIRTVLDERIYRLSYIKEMEGYHLYKLHFVTAADSDLPVSFSGFRRALYFSDFIRGKLQIFGYRNGISYSLAYLHRCGLIGKDSLFEIINHYYSVNVGGSNRRKRDESAEKYMSEWINYYRYGEYCYLGEMTVWPYNESI